MARNATARWLDAGDAFPQIDLALVDGRRLSLPGDLTQPFNVVLVNRGSFCPYCVGQLRAFQSALPKLAAEGIGVVSFSADSLDKALELKREQQLEFPIGYGVSVETVAERLGVYYEPRKGDAQPFLHSAGFIVRDAGKVVTAVYSSGAIGRLAWHDVLGFVQYVKSRK